MTIPVRVVVLSHGLGLPLPHYATPDSAGCDLRAALSEPLVLEPGQRHCAPAPVSPCERG